MSCLADLCNIEKLLRLLLAKLDALKKMETNSGLQQFVIRHMIRYLVADINSAIEEHLGQQDEEEKARLRYEARLRMPIFSHLQCILREASTAMVSGSQPV